MKKTQILSAVTCGLTASILGTYAASGSAEGAITTSVTPTALVVPQHDPFYSPPAGWTTKSPGTILRSRPVTIAFASVLPRSTEAWQLLYRTTDRNGRPMSTVTTALLSPTGPRPKTIVSYQVPEDAVSPQCAPSYEFRQGSGLAGVVNQIELPLIDSALAEGNVVVLPDYEGPHGEWGAPRQPGYAVLDGLRAARQFTPLGLPGRATRTAIWGYSGGSIASGWAAQLQPTYAPDVDLRGVAVGGFASVPFDPMKAVNGGYAAGFIPSIIPGMMRSSAAVAAVFDRYLTARGKAIMANGSTQCELQNLATYPLLNMDNLLTIPWNRFVALPAVVSAMNALNLGSVAPKAPMFVYHAATDEIVPIAGPEATLKRYCALGASVTFDRYVVGEHVSLAVTAAPTALTWMQQRLNGAPAPRGCTTTTYAAISTTPAELQGTTPLLGGLLTSLLG